jgi:hypothetical protein
VRTQLPCVLCGAGCRDHISIAADGHSPSCAVT